MTANLIQMWLTPEQLWAVNQYSAGRLLHIDDKLLDEEKKNLVRRVTRQRRELRRLNKAVREHTLSAQVHQSKLQRSIDNLKARLQGNS